MISCFQNAFVPLQKSDTASLSMAFACNAVECVGHVRGVLVTIARAVACAALVRGATNAVVQPSHRRMREQRDGGIGRQSIECSDCTVAGHKCSVETSCTASTPNFASSFI